MNKKLLQICIIIIMSVIFTSCSSEYKREAEPVKTTENKVNESIDECGPTYNLYELDTYDELKQALYNSEIEKYIKINESDGERDKVCKDMLAAFADKKIKLALPKYNGKDFPLWNNKDFSNILLFSEDLYRLPWIWYTCTINDVKVIVAITYPEIIEGIERDTKSSYIEIISKINPSIHLLDNKDIYEKEIILDDNYTVTAMIEEYDPAFSRIRIGMNYEGLMVTLLADKDLFTDEFFKSFSMEFE